MAGWSMQAATNERIVQLLNEVKAQLADSKIGILGLPVLRQIVARISDRRGVAPQDPNRSAY